MSAPFYVSPEQLMKDRADFARKGIARGRSVIVVACRDGIALVADNPSPSLRKLSEIYDRIGFAAVGKYNEFESLRQGGIRYADVRGYSYSRKDVSARGLVSVYAQDLGAVFTADGKPLEVELAVAEVGHTPEGDKLFRLTFDGSIADEPHFIVMGGDTSEAIDYMRENASRDAGFAETIRTTVAALGHKVEREDVVLGASDVEVAVLDRDPEILRGSHRCFRRLGVPELEAILDPDTPTP